MSRDPSAPLTDQEFEAYARDLCKGVCPFCEIWTLGVVERYPGPDTALEVVWCPGCNIEWNERYVVVNGVPRLASLELHK